MEVNCIKEAIGAIRREIVIQTTNDPQLIQQAYRLRYQIYCVENNFLPGSNQLEYDDFDAHSRHVFLHQRHTGEMVGTLRLVLPLNETPLGGLPVQQVCHASLLKELPSNGIAEISRFAIPRSRPGVSRLSAVFLRLGLMRGLVQLSGELGLTHWCGVMDPRLLRLLAMTAIHFVPLGPLVDHHGYRQPASGAISDILGRMAREQPAVWDFITEGNRLWREPARREQLYREPVRELVAA